MTRRLLLLTVIFLASAAYTRHVMEPEQVPLRRALGDLTFQLGDFRGQDAPPFSRDVLDVLGVDAYLNRVYTPASGVPVGLYVGYYQSQRQGDAIHSPANCLPGAGWQPVTHQRLRFAVEGRATPVDVNRYLIQKGLDRQVVLYWYQSHGRLVASEYASKAYLLYDAVRLNRSEAALVRIISPIAPGEDEAIAESRAVAFAQALLPALTSHLPS